MRVGSSDGGVTVHADKGLDSSLSQLAQSLNLTSTKISLREGAAPIQLSTCLDTEVHLAPDGSYHMLDLAR